MTSKPPTRERILDAATDMFGVRGVDAVSLDMIAADVGVAKQTLLYWFPSKDDLVQAVLVEAASELTIATEAAIRATGDDPLDRIEAVVRAVFRPAVRRPALLGLIREVSRLSPAVGERFHAELRPLVDRAVGYLQKEMDRGRIRQADPRLIAALCYATVTGIATEPELLRSVGWQPTTADLRRLRGELLAFLRAALAPSVAADVALAIPVDAILEGHGDQALVFVVDPATGAATRTRISTGRMSGALVAVTAGLAAGDQIVVDGAGYLSDGEKVLISTASAE